MFRALFAPIGCKSEEKVVRQYLVVSTATVREGPEVRLSALCISVW